MSEPTPIRVMIVDDHLLVRDGLKLLLSTFDDLAVVTLAEDGGQAVDLCQQVQPDVVLMDIVMPGMDGLEATRRITASAPQTRVLVLTSFAGDDQVFPAIRAGALGYLLKDSRPDELVAAIRQVHNGESWLDPLVARRLLQELAPRAGQDPEDESLTPREIEVLQLVAQGHTNRQIAEELSISEATVRTHMSKILGKLHLGSRTQAALYALREGIASLHDGAEPV
jgi:NarL family two-component system response regulator LiaR